MIRLVPDLIAAAALFVVALGLYWLSEVAL